PNARWFVFEVFVANVTNLDRARPTLKSNLRHRASGRINPPLPSNSTTLAERIYQQLKSEIIHGTFQPGEAINEKVLAIRYRGSRTPVREAIMRLQQESLLRLVPQKGYFVSHLTIHELNEMYEYRAELEGFCAEVAAKRWADTALLDRLTEHPSFGSGCPAKPRSRWQRVARLIQRTTSFTSRAVTIGRSARRRPWKSPKITSTRPSRKTRPMLWPTSGWPIITPFRPITSRFRKQKQPPRQSQRRGRPSQLMTAWLKLTRQRPRLLQICGTGRVRKGNTSGPWS